MDKTNCDNYRNLITVLDKKPLTSTDICFLATVTSNCKKCCGKVLDDCLTVPEKGTGDVRKEGI